MRDFIRGACVVLFGGHAWFYSGCVCGFIQGHAWFYSGGRAWFYSAGGMHGFIQQGGHACSFFMVFNERAVSGMHFFGSIFAVFFLLTLEHWTLEHHRD